VGGDAIQISLGLPAASVHIFNGTLLFFLITGDFFLRNRIRYRAEQGRKGKRSMDPIVVSVCQRTLIAGTPLLLGTIGEVICERSGVLNLGVEGMMAVGAVTAFIVTFTTGNPWLGTCAAIARRSAVLSSSTHFASVSLQANQVVSGLALTMLGSRGFPASHGQTLCGATAGP
jgi:ABC-type uncharacterized transport system permease subunit